jgi:transcriptional regulator with XRE-family HTH domain
MENYDDMKREIGQRVAVVRKKAGEKQTELAEALGVDVRTYRTREVGTSFFPIPELIQIAERYRQTLDFLLTGKESPLNDPYTDLILRLLTGVDETTKKTVLFLLEQRATNS